jgi:hypothetical protein
LVLAEQRRAEEAIENLACVATTGADEVPAPLGPFDLVVLGEESPDAERSLPFTDPDAPRRLGGAIVPNGYLMYGVRFPRSAALVRTIARPSRDATPMFYPAHARMLAAAGFSDVRGYGRRPDTRPYQVHIPLDDPGLVGYWMGQGPRPARIRPRLTRVVKEALVGLGAPHYLFNNFLVIARRGR